MSYRKPPAEWRWMCGSPLTNFCLNRAKVRVRQNSVRVLDEELKSQQQSFSAGIVSNLNVQRAEVALANERPELFNAQTQLKGSYLRLGDLFGTEVNGRGETAPFEVSGELQYQADHPDLNDCLARADANRAVIKARQKDIEIEDQQYILDRSAIAATCPGFLRVRGLQRARSRVSVPNLTMAVWWE